MSRYPVAILSLCAALALGACAEARDAAPPADGPPLQARVDVPAPSPDPAAGAERGMPGPEADPAHEPVTTGFEGLTETDATCGRLELTDEEWRARLTPEEYRILREKGTERAFTGKFWKTKTPGKYVCSGCDLELFKSTTKFDSGTGWPSFWEPAKEGHVTTKIDTTAGMVRKEILCGRCDAHLGHVFPDGPKPTGERYCVNSMALKLVPDAPAKD